MLPGWPFWNSTVSRSYPGCVPVRNPSMYADSGGLEEVIGAEEAQTNGGRLESGGTDGLAVGLALGDAEAAGVGLDPAGPAVEGGRFSGLAMNRTPITTAAITAAANPAIQNGPRSSGPSAIEDRTRSGNAALGVPAMSSMTWLSSRRKFSLVT